MIWLNAAGFDGPWRERGMAQLLNDPREAACARDGATTLLIAQELASPDIGGRNRLTGWLRRLFGPVVVTMIGAAAYIACRLNPRATVVANDYVAGKLHGRIPAKEMLRYERSVMEVMESADYSPLHRFVDILDDTSRRLSASGGGFEHHGVSLLKVNEIRWVAHVVYADVVLRFFERVLTRGGWRRVAALGVSAQLPLIVRAADRLGLTMSNSTRLFARLSGLRAERNHGHFIDSVLPLSFERPAHFSKPSLPGPKIKGERRLLAIGNYDRTMERFERLLPVLKAQGFSVHLLALPRINILDRLVDDHGVQCSLVADWMSSDEVERLRAEALSKAKRWWQELVRTRHEKSALSEEGARFDNVQGILRSYFLHGAESAMAAAEIGRRVIDRIEPDIVLNFEDWEFNRGATLVAEQRGIPTVAYYCLSAEAQPGLVRRTQSWMAVAGKNLYRSHARQYPPARIRIVGDPLAASPGPKLGAKELSAMRGRFGLDMNRPVLAIMSSYPSDGVQLSDLEVMFKRSFDAANCIGDIQIVVKAHPAQLVSQVQQWLDAWNCHGALILQGVPLYDLCACVDLVSVPITTAVHQALLAGTPVVNLQPIESLEQFDKMGFDYLAGKGIVHVPPTEDAVSVVRSLLFDHAARQAQVQRGYDHVAEHSGPLDGKAPERFVAFVEDILKQTKNSPEPL